MAKSPVPYVVRQGETLLSIAAGSGVDPDLIWDHPRNAGLVAVKRRDPDMLAPNDVLYLPSEAPPRPGVALASRNRFEGWAPAVEVALAFHDDVGPMADEPYELDGVRAAREGPVTGRLGGDGGLVVGFPVWVKHFTLRFPRRASAHTVWVGHLDPWEELSGLRQRLRNLGHLSIRHREGDPGDFTDAESERLTLWWFQRAHGLEATGFPDEATRARAAALSGG